MSKLNELKKTLQNAVDFNPENIQVWDDGGSLPLDPLETGDFSILQTLDIEISINHCPADKIDVFKIVLRRFLQQHEAQHCNGINSLEFDKIEDKDGCFNLRCSFDIHEYINVSFINDKPTISYCSNKVTGSEFD